MWLQKLSVHKHYKESPNSGIFRVLHVLHTWFVCLKKQGVQPLLTIQWQNEYGTGITVLGTFSGRMWDTFYITGKLSWAANLMECGNHPFSAKTGATCYFHAVWKRLKCEISHGCVILHCLQVFTIFNCKWSGEKWTHISFNAKKGVKMCRDLSVHLSEIHGELLAGDLLSVFDIFVLLKLIKSGSFFQ